MPICEHSRSIILFPTPKIVYNGWSTVMNSMLHHGNGMGSGSNAIIPGGLDTDTYKLAK